MATCFGGMLIGCSDYGVTDGITPQELLGRLDADAAPVVLDVRSQAEFNSGHVPGAVNIPHTEVHQRLDEIRQYQDRTVVVHCEGGARAIVAENILRRSGFNHVFHLSGDMAAWRDQGLPIEKPPPVIE